MTGAAPVLQHPDHRVADAVDVREKGLGDNRYAHTITVSETGCRYGYRRGYGVQTLTQGGWLMRSCLGVLAATTLWLAVFGVGSAHADVPRTGDDDGVLVGFGASPGAVGDLLRPAMPVLRGV